MDSHTITKINPKHKDEEIHEWTSNFEYQNKNKHWIGTKLRFKQIKNITENYMDNSEQRDRHTYLQCLLEPCSNTISWLLVGWNRCLWQNRVVITLIVYQNCFLRWNFTKVLTWWPLVNVLCDFDIV